MKLNFEKLNIKQLLFGGNAQTRREQFENSKKIKFKEIDLNYLISSIEELEVDYEKEFDQLTDFAIYIFYLIVLIIVIYIQLKMSISEKFSLTSSLTLNKNVANFRSITIFSQSN